MISDISVVIFGYVVTRGTEVPEVSLDLPRPNETIAKKVEGALGQEVECWWGTPMLVDLLRVAELEETWCDVVEVRERMRDKV